jgi:ABC-type antimicrobial peptide transport system permease subunit
VGIATGLVASLVLGRLVASLLFGVVPSDPAVLIGASVVLLAIAATACLIPAFRASRVDPVNALRAD